MDTNLILSIVVVTKDNPNDLICTLESLTNLSNSEIIVVNGSHNKVSLNGKLRQELCCLTVLDGPDDGIYDGMNRGIWLAKGQYVWFLNSGDRNTIFGFYEGLISLLSKKSPPWIIGMQTPYLKFPRLGLYLSKALLLMGIRPIPHQSVIVKKSLLMNFAGYDTRHRIAADQKLFLQLYQENQLPFLVYVPFSERKLGGIGDMQIHGSFFKQIKEISKEISLDNPTWTILLSNPLRFLQACKKNMSRKK